MGGNYEGGLTPQGFIQDFELGGEKQDGSRMIVACESISMRAY